MWKLVKTSEWEALQQRVERLERDTRMTTVVPGRTIYPCVSQVMWAFLDHAKLGLEPAYSPGRFDGVRVVPRGDGA